MKKVMFVIIVVIMVVLMAACSRKEVEEQLHFEDMKYTVYELNGLVPEHHESEEYEGLRTETDYFMEDTMFFAKDFDENDVLLREYAGFVQDDHLYVIYDDDSVYKYEVTR